MGIEIAKWIAARNCRGRLPWERLRAFSEEAHDRRRARIATLRNDPAAAVSAGQSPDSEGGRRLFRQGRSTAAFVIHLRIVGVTQAHFHCAAEEEAFSLDTATWLP